MHDSPWTVAKYLFAASSPLFGCYRCPQNGPSESVCFGGKVMRQWAQLPTLMVVVEGSQFRSVNVAVVVVVEKSCTANTVGFSRRLAK